MNNILSRGGPDARHALNYLTAFPARMFRSFTRFTGKMRNQYSFMFSTTTGVATQTDQ